MKKLIAAALAVSAFALAPLCAFASDDKDEFERECRQAAMDEGVPAEDVANYIADCVAENLAGRQGEGAGEKEEAAESTMSE